MNNNFKVGIVSGYTVDNPATYSTLSNDSSLTVSVWQRHGDTGFNSFEIHCYRQNNKFVTEVWDISGTIIGRTVTDMRGDKLECMD